LLQDKSPWNIQTGGFFYRNNVESLIKNELGIS